jgi:hypothetical protein
VVITKPTRENIMKKIAASMKSRMQSAARWYAESWSHMDPAVALGMFGTGMVAVPMTAAATQADAR